MNEFSEVIQSDGGKSGWKNIQVNTTENSMIGLHLMPGKFVAKQEGQFLTTADLQLGTKSNLTFIANRDSNGAAHSKIYIDDGFNSEGGPEA